MLKSTLSSCALPTSRFLRRLSRLAKETAWGTRYQGSHWTPILPRPSHMASSQSIWKVRHSMQNQPSSISFFYVCYHIMHVPSYRSLSFVINVAAKDSHPSCLGHVTGLIRSGGPGAKGILLPGKENQDALNSGTTACAPPNSAGTPLEPVGESPPG